MLSSWCALTMRRRRKHRGRHRARVSNQWQGSPPSSGIPMVTPIPIGDITITTITSIIASIIGGDRLGVVS
jgi:hypothetical protein